MKTLKVVLNDSVGDRLRRVAETFGVSETALAEALIAEGLHCIEKCATLKNINVPDAARRAAGLRVAYGDEAAPRIRSLLRALGVAKPDGIVCGLTALGAALARPGRRRAATRSGRGDTAGNGTQPGVGDGRGDGSRECPGGVNGPENVPEAGDVFEAWTGPEEDLAPELFWGERGGDG